MSVPEVESVFSVMGFSFAGSAPNQGLIFTLLKPFAEREEPEQRIQGLLPKIRGALFGIQDGLVIRVRPAVDSGARQLRRLHAPGSRSERARQHPGARRGHCRRWSARRSSRPAWPGCSAASPPTIRSWPWTSTARRRAASVCRSARSRARCRSISGLPTSTTSTSTTARIASTCRRTRRTAPIRGDLGQYYARTERGEMVPLASVVRVRETTAPQVISHFNLFRSAEVSGSAAPGYSSGQAIDEM